MNSVFKAKIQWLTAETDDSLPPRSTQYKSVARFQEEPPQGEMIGWGVIAEFDTPPSVSQESVAQVRLLVPDGPTQYLHPGSRFELFEGRRVVARGEVLSDEATEAPTVVYQSKPNLSVIKDTPLTSEHMSTASETTPPAIDTLRAELAEKEEKLRKLVRQLDQLARTEFRDRAQRLKQMREQRAELETDIDELRAKIQQASEQ